ncbi:Uncharacterized protein FWK35_00033681, partial [Aphis craccivora]
MSASSYIPLPDFIEKKKAIINSQNSDQQCFKKPDIMDVLYFVNDDSHQHKLICGTHKPILPRIPTSGSMLEFDAWKKTQRHPIVIYANFEALLRKSHETNNDVPMELLEQFYIPTSPIIVCGDEDNQNVGEHFVKSIVEIAENIEKLLQTNITFTAEQQQEHNLCKTCNLCKKEFSVGNHKVADHCHLSGKFRQTLCNTCNLKLQTSNFLPCFFHNLSNYDAHFIVTELGLDVKTISVIPNSEEKFISFSKHVSNNFSILFIDTIRFMASSLSTLSENLLTPGFEKFRETAKHFNAQDLPLITRKGVYPYEYTDGRNKLEQTHLPKKADFYSTLTESNIQEEDYEHAKTNFRDLCLTTYCLDPSFYYTAPWFSFDCMLKYTRVKLELLSEYDMLLMIE